MDPEKAFVKTLTEAASAIGIELSDRELALFRAFRREFLLWNSRINLVSIRTPLDLPIKHCVDSLLCVPLIEKRDGTLLDIGTGAGFPGIPLKIVIPSLSVSLLDSSRKKTSYLKEVAARLRLEGVRVIHGRVEQIAADAQYAGAFDTVVSRAAFKLSDLLMLGSRFLSGDSRLIAMKGKDVASELEAARSALDRTGLRKSQCGEMRLPVLGGTRNLLVFTRG